MFLGAFTFFQAPGETTLGAMQCLDRRLLRDPNGSGGFPGLARRII